MKLLAAKLALNAMDFGTSSRRYPGRLGQVCTRERYEYRDRTGESIRVPSRIAWKNMLKYLDRAASMAQIMISGAAIPCQVALE